MKVNLRVWDNKHPFFLKALKKLSVNVQNSLLMLQGTSGLHAPPESLVLFAGCCTGDKTELQKLMDLSLLFNSNCMTRRSITGRSLRLSIAGRSFFQIPYNYG